MRVTAAVNILTVNSVAFKMKGQIPVKYACDGEGINPPLEMNNIPADAKSLVLIMDDPDAPKGLFTHWIVWNIPPNNMIAENSNPGISGINSARKTGYHPPCPPSGSHRYYFKIYALDTTLDLEAGETRDALEDAMAGHIISQGELMGYYAMHDGQN